VILNESIGFLYQIRKIGLKLVGCWHVLEQKHGFEGIGRARLTNDALIAVSASRTGVTVITSNARDFARLAEFQPLRWKSVQS
jgi:predicted nucleic acid-binding protein